MPIGNEKTVDAKVEKFHRRQEGMRVQLLYDWHLGCSCCDRLAALLPRLGLRSPLRKGRSICTPSSIDRRGAHRLQARAMGCGSGTVLEPDRKDEPEQFGQIWFAGNHADIGGSYPENESRLSDITLDWMVDFISKKIPEAARVIVDPDLLKLYPSSDGMMHDECMVGMAGTSIKW